MNTFYISKIDGTDKTYFEIDPIVPPSPKERKNIIQFTSVASWTDAGVIVPSAQSTLDLGVVDQGGIINLKGEYMSLTSFDAFYSKYAINPPEEFVFYDAVRAKSYRVIISNFDYEYITGMSIVSWSMDLINLEVLV